MDADHVSAWSKGEQQTLKIVRCFVKLIIEPKVIDRIIAVF